MMCESELEPDESFIELSYSYKPRKKRVATIYEIQDILNRTRLTIDPPNTKPDVLRFQPLP